MSQTAYSAPLTLPFISPQIGTVRTDYPVRVSLHCTERAWRLSLFLSARFSSHRGAVTSAELPGSRTTPVSVREGEQGWSPRGVRQGPGRETPTCSKWLPLLPSPQVSDTRVSRETRRGAQPEKHQAAMYQMP